MTSTTTSTNNDYICYTYIAILIFRSVDEIEIKIPQKRSTTFRGNIVEWKIQRACEKNYTRTLEVVLKKSSESDINGRYGVSDIIDK